LKMCWIGTSTPRKYCDHCQRIISGRINEYHIANPDILKTMFK
jgi:hypothetical protein